MALPDIYYIEVDQVFHFATIVLIIYLIFRDNKNLNLINTRYDKLIVEVLDTITKQQIQYKNEISADMRNLSTHMTEVFAAVSQVVSGVKDVEKEVSKVDHGVDEVVEAVTEVTEGVKNVIRAISEVVVSIKEVRTCDLELSKNLKSTVENLHQTSLTLIKISDSLKESPKQVKLISEPPKQASPPKQEPPKQASPPKQEPPKQVKPK